MQSPGPTDLLLDYTREQIAVVDGDGTYEYVNDAAERILGYAPATLVGENVFEYVHPTERDDVFQYFRDVIESGQRYADTTATYRHRASDGSWVWLESSISNLSDSTLGGYLLSSREVTDRIEAERKRRESETRLRELSNTSNDVLWMFDADWEELLFCNPAYEDVFGAPVSELEDDPQRFLDTIHPDDVPAVKDAMARLSDGEAVDMEYRVNPAREYDRWVWVQGEPISEDGEVVRIVGFARDVTHRRRRERQLAVMDNLLRHNLRNQLNAILGHAELIQDTGQGETDEMVTVIRRAAAKLLETADKQREIVQSLHGADRPQRLDLSGVVRDAAETMRERYPDATIHDHVPAGVSVRALEITASSVHELVENAIRHCDHDHPAVTLDARVDDEVTLTVTDNCQRLPEYDERVLTGDHEMDAVYHSSGCGLWLVYWSVDLSDGRVGYDYEDGSGNVVRITLPRP